MTDKFDEFVSAEDACGAMKWISVKDGLPDGNVCDFVECIVYETLNNKVQHDYFSLHLAKSWNHYGKHVTHWMPLPEPPKDE